ncbi:MAG: cystathionine beta-synthase [Acidimicrobiales bacterium]|nr:cystathionine beta-synthase [Acidimicrobiales bacterium]
MLVVVGDEQAPERLSARAAHVVRTKTAELTPDVVADLRSRIPRHVGVVGPVELANETATHLHHAGLPVTLYADGPVTAHDGVDVEPLTDPGPAMEAADSLLDLVGDTPLVRLDRTGRNLSCHMLGKLEFLNPGGSVKDRPAIAMVEAAERAGLIGPGGTIVEPTSGNTGVGLAIVAARRRYRCIFVMPDKMSQEKIALLRAYGAEVVVCPTTVAPEHPDSYYSVAARLSSEIPGAYQPSQYHNPENPKSHERTTGPEIWRQTAGRITHFVAGIGTGGTITGVSRYLKAQNPGVQIVGADPQGSVYSGGGGRPYLVEGIGEDFWPDTYDPAAVDRVVTVTDRDSFLTARRVTREEGILVGGSAGTAVWAALEVGRELGPDDVMVVLIPDSGRGYLSKLFNDEWMADFGFLRSGGQTVGDVLERKAADLPTLVHVHPDESVRDVIGVLREYSVSQVPVLKAELPLAVAEVSGAVHERDLMERAFAEPDLLDRPVAEVMGPPLPTVGSGEPVEVAVERLDQASAILVVDAGHPVGILTRSDVLSFLAQRPST